ncbi:MAG: GNAT family N-acetyltransferase [Pseudomonadales bacterium]|nr:GNAT family N-acetyltransferase [Pseudomonadales bacterium]NRA14552.1 GNAT family N-acetyltransferase [Oceanospirillaceae bacterium]
MLEFVKAQPNQNVLLRDILIESKGYWGYTGEQLEIWRSNLKFESDYISNNTVKLITKDSKVIGFYALTRGDVDELDHFWLLPEAIGLGHGNITFEHILKECSSLGISEFFIVSDPDAEGFYLKNGAVSVGEVYSAPQKRMLPKLKYLVG